MEIEKLKEPLSIFDIEFRIQSINKGGYATILAYKNARVDMNRLDDVCGQFSWKREHLNNNANCIVSVWDESKKQWISKEDTGTESMTEKAKGLASDSFKRACFNWGIGRELYDYPVIKIKLNQNQNNDAYGEWFIKDNKPRGGYGLKLKEWIWINQFTNGVLSYLVCEDEKGQIRFKYGEYIKPLIE